MTTRNANSRWDHKPLRIAALQVASKPEDNLAVLEKWHACEFDVEQLLHVYGDDYFGLYDSVRFEKQLRTYIAEAHAKGIRIIAYANVMNVPTVKREPVDDWYQVSSKGAPTKGCCVNSPYRDHALNAIRGTMECGADGVFMDGPHVHGDCCYCKTCDKLFRDAHGIAIPKNESDPTSWEQFQQFRRDSITRFVRDVYETVHSVKADGVVYLNHFVFNASTADGQTTRDLLPLMDWIGSEGGFQFYGFPQRAMLWKVGSTAKMLESIAPDKPRVIFINGANCPWNYLIHSAPETELMIASTAANAANHWYCFCVGLDDFESEGAAAAKAINHKLSLTESYFTRTQSAAKVAVLWSQDTIEVYNQQAPESDLMETGGKHAPNTDIPLDNKPGWTLGGLPSAAREPYASYNATYEILWRSQVLFDVLHDQYLDAERLKQYEVIILPNLVCMSENVTVLLREFVQAGGKLIASFESSLSSIDGIRQPNFQLADVFGVDFQGTMRDFHHYAKMDVPIDGVPGKGLFRSVLPAPRYGLPCEATTAKPLIHFYAPFPEYYMPLTVPDVPALFHNQFGKGECYYFSAKFCENYSHYGFGEYRLIFDNLLDSLMPRQLVVEADAETIEVALRKPEATGHSVLHVINYSGSHKRPIHRTVRLNNVRLTLRLDAKPVRVRDIFANEELDFTWQDGCATVVLNQLDTYKALSFESA
ncbi:MAG: beta-galactosidase trimerization domain-containing protein [Verrucomicrobia bacterium]|nr:beta-galactosidase trimerization domain-containing protein [Verrucomicrobiota bacterium]